MNNQIKFYPAGDKCIQINLGNTISPEINMEVRKFFLGLKTMAIKGITECVPTYSTLSIYYDPLVISYDQLITELKNASDNLKEQEVPQPYVFELPTCYDKAFGFDLDYVAEHCNISIDEVIKIHSDRDYLIYMLGFTPGYCYLGGMSEKIAAPRLVKPRTHVPAGSVGIAGTQTGIYPIESPGGWQLIGRTPVDLYNPLRKDNPILLESGNYIRFVPITMTEYEIIQRDVNDSNFTIKKTIKRV